MWNPFQLLFPKKFLGIDIGTSFIKLLEVSKFGYRRRLENYGSLPASMLYEKTFRTFEKNTLTFSNKDISRAIKAIMEEAKIKTRQVAFSIPDFSTFFTTFELPPMTKEELPQAVKYEARIHIPVPLSEVDLDWQIIGGEPSKEKDTKIKILLLAVPKEVINQYQEIARITQLELVILEAEVFGLVRSLISEDERRTVAIVDIGAQSSTCNIIEKRILRKAYSFDMSGNELTRIVSKGLGVDYKEAEKLKENHGIAYRTLKKKNIKKDEQEICQILLPLIDVIIKEVEKVFNDFYQEEGKDVQKIILAGSSALLPGLKEYFIENFQKEIEIANPFTNLFYPPILEKKLKQMGPSYSIAVGMALRGLEF